MLARVSTMPALKKSSSVSTLTRNYEISNGCTVQHIFHGVPNVKELHYWKTDRLYIDGNAWKVSSRWNLADGVWVRVRLLGGIADTSVMAIVIFGLFDYRRSPLVPWKRLKRMMVARQTCLIRLATREEMQTSGIMHNNSVSIKCTVHVIQPVGRQVEGPEAGPILVSSTSGVHHDLRHLLKCMKGTDITFSVRGKTFPAHRCVIVARSPVLALELLDPKKKHVTINHMEPVVFKAMLYFIYTDILPETEKLITANHAKELMVMTQNLFVAAEQYSLDRMKVICEARLCKGIDMDIVERMLAFAEQHHCQNLLKFCCRFIVSKGRLEDIVCTDWYKSNMVDLDRPAIGELFVEAGRALKKARIAGNSQLSLVG